MTTSKTRRAILGVSAAAILAAGGVAVHHYVGSASAQTPPYRTQPVAKQRIVATVTASGTISPLKTVQVGSQVSGRLLDIAADFNSVVTRGQVIAHIDPRLFESEVARAQANLASAKAGVAKAVAAEGESRRQSERSKQLVERGVLSIAEGDTAQSTAKTAGASRVAAAADVKQAEAALQQAETNLALTTIVSPIDGVVISRDVDVGQTVAASLQAPTLFTIAGDLKQMEVHTSVAESDIGQLQPGMKAVFTVDAFPGTRFRGEVTQIRNAPTTVQNVVTYDAVVRTENPELKLRPGMTANVTFTVVEKNDVLAVPAAALRFTPANVAAAPARRGARVVWVLDNDTPTPVEVTTGVTDGRNTEIVGGDVKENMLVIVGNSGDTKPAAQQQGQQRPGGAGGGRRGGFGL